jgi:putative membrane protein
MTPDKPRDEKSAASISDYLAAERTFLAWIRTGLALMGFGFVIARFGIFLQEFQDVEHVPSIQSNGQSLWFGTIVIVVGVIVNVFAGYNHIRLVRQLNRGVAAQFRPSIQAIAIAFFLALVGAAMAIYVVSIRNSTGSKKEVSVALTNDELVWRQNPSRVWLSCDSSQYLRPGTVSPGI